MREYCAACGLHLAAREQGDGPAFFGIVIVGAVATIGAATVEILYEPPYWLHALIWPVVIIVGSLLCLRVAKAMMLALHYTAKPDDFK